MPRYEVTRKMFYMTHQVVEANNENDALEIAYTTETEDCRGKVRCEGYIIEEVDEYAEV